MKRSEALKEISNLLKKCNGTYENHRNATAENILNKLEEIGMLPPSRKFNYKEQQAMKLGLSSLGEFEEYHKWEPENE